MSLFNFHAKKKVMDNRGEKDRGIFLAFTSTRYGYSIRPTVSYIRYEYLNISDCYVGETYLKDKIIFHAIPNPHITNKIDKQVKLNLIGNKY